MTYEVIDTASANVLGDYPTKEAAQATVAWQVQEHPEMADDLAVVPIDERGHAVSSPVPAAEFVGELH